MMAQQTITQAAAFPIALAVIPSLPRAALKRLVERLIDRIDEIDGDRDLEDDDPDTGAEDHPFDEETDYCLAHEDYGTPFFLTRSDHAEVQRVKRAARQLRRRAKAS